MQANQVRAHPILTGVVLLDQEGTSLPFHTAVPRWETPKSGQSEAGRETLWHLETIGNATDRGTATAERVQEEM